MYSSQFLCMYVDMCVFIECVCVCLCVLNEWLCVYID
jgi:hypothetical protein